MSRTKKGEKSPGHDYWGKRKALGYGDHGTKGKRVGIQKERAELKREVPKPCEHCFDDCTEEKDCGCDCHYEGIGRGFRPI